MKQKKEHDMAALSKATTGLGLRVLVSGYIIYLACKILKGTLDGGPIPLWAGWLIFAVFAGAGISFLVFATKQYLLTRKLAELPENNENVEKDETDEDDN